MHELWKVTPVTQAYFALIAEDTSDIAGLMQMTLTRLGVDSHHALNGVLALEFLSERLPDILLLDIGMPGMNGYDLALALRSLPEYRDVPLIAVTGFSIYDDRGRALECGFNAHLTKPINPMTLLDLIKSLRD